MKQIFLKSIEIENFKGLKSFSGTFTENTEIFGKNAVGKTTVFDSLTWLLFDKDSKGNSNFSIRPKDENGDDVNSLEVKVEGTFLVDEETVILTKTQRQKWTKKRGHSERVFEGNENIFEIDNYPVKKTEYTAKVSSIIEESLFRLMTDPTAFANLPWKDQRQILVRFVSDITDADILALDE
jgi:predicted ATP-dependent endonuclease of OLD family